MRNAILNVDLGFGDSGKGSFVDFQTRTNKATLNVRFNGGAQAAHNVHLSDGRHHTFSQFGSGSFSPGVQTYLSQHVLVNPISAILEAQDLTEKGIEYPLGNLFVHEDALITTPYHGALNRIKERLRGRNRHGSCGKGIGETVLDSLERPDQCIRAKDLNLSLFHIKYRLDEARHYLHQKAVAALDKENANLYKSELEIFNLSCFERIAWEFHTFSNQANIISKKEIKEFFNKHKTVIFEPAQGVLIDQNFGFHPYTTWSDCTLRNAYSILSELEYGEKVKSYGILRTFATRHGAGPFVTEDKRLTKELSDPNNPANDWQQGFRCGHLDLVALQYALQANGPVDALALSHCDAVDFRSWKMAEHYTKGEDYWKPKLPRFQAEQIKLTKDLMKVRPIYLSVCDESEMFLEIENSLNTDIELTSYGKLETDKKYI